MGSPDGSEPAKPSPPVPLEGDGAELIGMVVDGRYRLDAPLGRGGMGLVFRGTHVGLRRQVAVKILHPALAASPEVRNRFEREALASGKIDHPNCVSVYDTGRLPDGSLYLAMELLEGKSLADVLEQDGQLAPGRALHILAHILRGLAHIHAAGLIHRDIKPENIFLIRQDDDLDFAKILDFGIAKGMTSRDLDDGVKLTQAGLAFGTPVYMAPEQALGNPMDGRADLYAAAVMAYEMLCGQPPFYSEDKLEVMAMHAGRPVPPMRQRLLKNARPVPSSIERLIVRGLTKKPSERYASAEVFLGEVEQALHTADGGATQVELEPAADTGSQPLVGIDGEVDLSSPHELVATTANIAAAIDEELSGRIRTPTPMAGQAGLPGGGRVPTGRLPHALAARPATGAAPHAGGARPPTGKVPHGGVGLGLPYTGPQGEPIFGLTPEQRLHQATPTPPPPLDISPAASTVRPLSAVDMSMARVLEPEPPRPPKRLSRAKWLLYGGVASAAVIAGVVFAIVTAAPGERTELDPDSPAGQASAALELGDPAKALAILDADKAAIADQPMAQLVLGHAHAARHESAASLAAYAQALALAPELEENPVLRANLRAMAADKDPAVVAGAFELWVGRTHDAEARPLLLKAAIAESLARRHGVRPVLDRLGLADDVDLLIAYSLDLEQEVACEKRREAVAKLRALNDPRAVPALERAVVRRIKSGALRGKPFNPCLLDDARAAIGYLRGLPTKQ